MANNKLQKTLIYGVPVAIGLYFIYKSWKDGVFKKKGQDSLNYDPKIDTDVKTSSDGKIVSPAVADYFPLKKGSKGAKVTELQKAILSYDNTLLPKYGADGDFGGETQTALNTVLGKTTVDSQEDINSIVQKAADKKKTQQTQADLKSKNDNRLALGWKIQEAWSKIAAAGGVAQIKVISDTQYSQHTVLTDGRTDVKSMGVAKKGETFMPFRVTVSREGFMKLWKKDNVFYYISPYSVAAENFF